jgi:hypothetical protein
MSERASAEEDLRVIRTLMERATTYRAISAPSALLAGLVSTLAAGAVYFNNEVKLVLGRTVGPREFGMIWMVVLLIAVLGNAFFVWREAKIAGRPFVSSGMRLALRAILPTLLIPAAFTLWFFETGYLGARELELVTIWVASYGLALLSTALFAPRSLALLGWAFLLSSVSIPVLMNAIDNLTDDVPDTVMGVTFGLFHLIYAVAAWPRRGAALAAAPATIE